MKLKKLLATTLAVILILSSVSMTAFAFENDEFDIENLTWDDIMTMSNEDFMRLLNQFEREYDPFGTYETNPLTENRSTLTEPEIQPLWTSGDEEVVFEDGKFKKGYVWGSHEFITARACGILRETKGFWIADESGSILLALSIALASTNPDRDPKLIGLSPYPYRGHFYNPDIDIGAPNTARTNAQEFYSKSFSCYTLDGESEEFITNVGNMVHYIQDACEPHHASDMKAGVTPHSQFEKYVGENIDNLIGGMKTIDNVYYKNALNYMVADLVHFAAKDAKKYANGVNDFSNTDGWGMIGQICIQNAVKYTAIVLYKLSIDANIPLLK